MSSNNDYKKPTLAAGAPETRGLAVPVFTFPMVVVAYSVAVVGVVAAAVNGGAVVNVATGVNVGYSVNVSTNVNTRG